MNDIQGVCSVLYYAEQEATKMEVFFICPMISAIRVRTGERGDRDLS